MIVIRLHQSEERVTLTPATTIHSSHCNSFGVSSITMATPPPSSSLCLTPACLKAASMLVSQIAPKPMWDKLDPCTDFDKLVCHQFPLLNGPGSSGAGQLDDTNGRIIRSILDGDYQHAITEQLVSWNSTFPTNNVDEANFNLLKRSYTSCMDVETIEKTGTKPLVDLIAAVNSLWPIKSSGTIELNSTMTEADYDGFTDVIAYLEELGVATLSTISVFKNPWNPKVRSIAMETAQLRQPNQTEYLDPVAMVKYANTTSQTLLEFLPGNVTVETAATLAEGIVLFELAMLKASTNLTAPKGAWDFSQGANMTVKEAANFLHFDKVFQALAPGYNQSIVVVTKDWWPALSKVVAAQPKIVLQSYLLLRAIDLFSPEVDSTQVSRNDKDRAGYCIERIDLDLKHILSRFYAAWNYPDSERQFAGDVATNIRSALKARISELDWMSAESKARAIKKVDNMAQSIGYYTTPTLDLKKPESLASFYQNLNMTTSHFANVVSSRAHARNNQFASLSRPVDRSFVGLGRDKAWNVNAGYSANENAMLLTAGFFQSPFFSDQLPRYISYGSLGAIVGHEVVHGFDSTGRHFNEDASPISWWDNSTVKAYEERQQCFIKQYDSYEYPISGGKKAKTNGKQTLGENISDAGGIRLAFEAWKKTTQDGRRKDAALPGLERFTNEQLFYMSYASVFCNSFTPEKAESAFATDVHAHNNHRIIGTTANSRGFREAWGCKVKEPTCEIF